MPYPSHIRSLRHVSINPHRTSSAHGSNRLVASTVGEALIDVDLTALDEDHLGVEQLLADIVRSEQVDLIAALPRPYLHGELHPATLLLHALARQYRFDRGSPDLGPDLLEALDGTLERRAPAWSALAAMTWTTWITHQGEPSSGWPIAAALLTRHADAELPALLLASFAALAERAGALSAAGELWEQARVHHDTIRSARTRWIVEYEWARVHLLQSGGAPGRAIVVLERVQAALAGVTDAPARLVRMNACLEQGFALAFVGRPSEALVVIERARRELREHESEFLPWLRGVEAFAHALAGDVVAAELALTDFAEAATDTTTLELAAVLPAQVVLDGIRGDIVSLRATLDDARAREHERVVDTEQCVIWRLLGAWALVRADRRSAAFDLVADLERVFETATTTLPAYEGQLALLRATLNRDPAAHRRAVERCAAHGIRVAAASSDPWDLVPAFSDARPRSPVTRVSGLDVRIDFLDGLRISIDGGEATDQLWQRRRKSQVLLAVLLAFDGHVGRDDIVETLWPGEALDAATCQSRLSTVLSSLRRALPGTVANHGTGARVVKLHAAQIELQLAAGDITDRQLVRELVGTVAAEDPRDCAAFERRGAELVSLVAGEPLRGIEPAPLVELARDQLAREMAGACAAVLERWLAASLAMSREPTPELALLAAHATRLQPLDEHVASLEMELNVRAGRIDCASRSFHRFREVLDDELGLPPSAEFVRRHAALVANA